MPALASRIVRTTHFLQFQLAPIPFLAGLKRNRLTYEKAFRCKIKDPDGNQVSTRREELSIRDAGRRGAW